MLLIRRKTPEALYIGQAITLICFPKMPRYCCPVEIFYLNFFSRVEIRLKFRTAFPDRQAGKSVKCLSQGYNRMAGVGFEPTPCQSQSQHS